MVLKLDVAARRKVRGMADLLDCLGANEGLTRFVGGTVRDDLLGLPHNDVDLATRLRPDEVMNRLEAAKIRAIPTGIDHGTVTAISSGRVVEVTSLRRDVSTDGRRATVAFTDDWKEDAARRDFTINALSADPISGELFDYFGGLADLEERRVRFIGNPLERIAEDHLRILRFFRFHGRFGQGAPDEAGLNACASRANDLMALSRERIADELLKILSPVDPSSTIALMIDHGILAPVIPEIPAGAAETLKRLIGAELKAGTAPDSLRRLSALLPRDTCLAEAVAVRLRLSNKARKRLGCAADESLGPNPRALVYAIGRDCAFDRLLLAGRPRDVADLGDWEAPRLPVSGGMLIARGLKPGPTVARALKTIEQRWVAADFPEDGDLLQCIVDDVMAEEGAG